MGDEEWMKQNELLRVVEVNEIQVLEVPAVKKYELLSLNFVRARTEPRRDAEVMFMSTLVLDLSHSMSSLLKSTNIHSFRCNIWFCPAFLMYGSTHSDPRQVSDSLLWQLEGEPDHLPACHDHTVEI